MPVTVHDGRITIEEATTMRFAGPSGGSAVTLPSPDDPHLIHVDWHSG